MDRGTAMIEKGYENGAAHQNGAGILKTLISDEVVLYMKTRNHYSGFAGPQFESLQKLLDSQSNDLKEIIDRIAVRSRQTGKRAPDTLKEFLKYTTLKESSDYSGNPFKAVEDLLADHRTVIRQLQGDLEAAENPYDSNMTKFLAAILKHHEGLVSMLEAHQQTLEPALEERRA